MTPNNDPKIEECDEQRISISFNLMFSSFAQVMSKPMWIGSR